MFALVGELNPSGHQRVLSQLVEEAVSHPAPGTHGHAGCVGGGRVGGGYGLQHEADSRSDEQGCEA